jgi:hypothetical protein
MGSGAIDEPWLGFLIDILIGIGIGLAAHALWGRYFAQRLPQEAVVATEAGSSELAFLWLLFMLAAGLLLAALLTLASLTLARRGLWISPVPMMVGATLDAFVLAGVQTALHLMGHSLRRHTAMSLTAWWLAHLPAAAWLGIVVTCLHHLSHP